MASRIDRLVGNFVEAAGLGVTFGAETAFRLKRNPDLVRCPDFAFVGSARIAEVLRAGANEGAPDLAVEVLSPSNTYTETSRKTAEYLRYGAREVWIVDPESRAVTVHAPRAIPRLLEGADVFDGGELLPGFAVPVAACFAGLPPAA